jgi:cytochrome P450
VNTTGTDEKAWDATVRSAVRSWGSQHRDDPYPLAAELLSRGSVHRVTLADGHDAYLVLGYDHARQALADPRLSKDMDAAFGSGDDVVAEGLPGAEFARHMLAVDPPDHTRLRRLVSAAFSTRRVEQLRPRVEEIVDELLDGIAARSDRPVDLVAGFALPLPFTVICELLGVPEQTRPALRAGLADLLVPTSDGDAYAQARRGSDVVVGVIGDLIESKRADRGDDLISALIDARDGQDRLGERELRSSIFQLIVAGYHTTTTMIGNSVVALLDHADQLADLRADPDLISNAVEELLRYDPPVPHATFRYATEPVTLGGVRIPAGAQVLVSLAAANHDPDRFTDPHALELHRDDARHLAFGHGTHFCLGAKLARMEGRIALAALLQRFPRLRLATDRDELHWDQGDGLVLRSLTELPVWVDSEAPKPPRPPTTAENNRS